MRKSLGLCLYAASLACPLAQADVIVVDQNGGGDFLGVAPAVQAAVDGDVILIRDGFYPEAAVIEIDGKALTLTAELGWDARIAPGFVIRNLPDGGQVVLENLLLFGKPSNATTPAGAALRLEDNLGHIRVQGCLVLGGGGAHNAQRDGAAGLVSSASLSVALVNSTVTGGDGQFSPDLSVQTGNGGPGVDWQSAGELFIENTTVYGGYGGSNLIGGWPDGGVGGTGMHIGAGQTYIATSLCSGGQGGTAHEGGDGGIGLMIESGASLASTQDAFFSGGSGGFSDAGPDGGDGDSVIDLFQGLQTLPGKAYPFVATSPVREFETGTFEVFNLPAGQQVLLFFSTSMAAFYVPEFEVLSLVSPAITAVLTLGPTVPFQPFDKTFHVPSLPLGMQSVQVAFQPLFFGSAGIGFGSGQVLTLLDDAF